MHFPNLGMLEKIVASVGNLVLDLFNRAGPDQVYRLLSISCATAISHFRDSAEDNLIT